ncbi:MAG: hypothetical protein K6G76_06755 [Lachnospiraceae bacterium]|nr:hypothetical protein [Lachnospiraceae bacterium]
MAKILSNEELIAVLKADYSAKTINKESLLRRQWNIDTFNALERKQLKYDKLEKRIMLYKTMEGEEVYIQYPGKESTENPKMPLDFRPKVKLKTGEYAIDLSFGAIWDILDDISRNHNAYLKYVAALFFRMGYMHEYKKIKMSYDCEIVKISKVGEKIEKNEKIQLEWYAMQLEEDVWYTLNDKMGWINLGNNQVISFEGFIKLVDLLFQNEDCKYYYKNIVIKKKDKYKLSSGRTNSSAANLFILNYLEGNVKLSKLLDAFQKSRGVPMIKKSDYSVVTDKIVINVDIESR